MRINHSTKALALGALAFVLYWAFPSTNAQDLPDYDPTVGPLITDRNPRHGNPYFNVNAFSQEVLGQFGNSKRRFFHGPGLNNTDLALLRDFHIHESHVIQLRVEAFNIFNHAQFQSPNGNFTDGPGAFGIVTAAEWGKRAFGFLLRPFEVQKYNRFVVK